MTDLASVWEQGEGGGQRGGEERREKGALTEVDAEVSSRRRIIKSAQGRAVLISHVRG